MRLFRFRVLIAGVVLGLLFQLTANGQSSATFDKQKLDTYFNKLAEKSKLMGSVAIDSAGTEVYHRSVGVVDSAKKRKADRNIKYRIGSVTKTFTAVMVFQLIEEGKLSLSTKLETFYPEVPQAQQITIEHLLRHQSGLFNFTNASDYTEWMTQERSKEQMLKLIREDEPQFALGLQTSYSNTNYVLLGYIIEDISGESYADQLEKRITAPLQLDDTYYGDGINPAKNEAVSFRYSQSQWRVIPETDMSIPGGAGGIVSNPDDLTDFIRALFKGKLVSRASLDQMTTIEQGLGMGLMKIPFYDTFAYGHNGGIDGFQSNLSYFPKEDVALAFTSNGLNYQMNDILIGVLSIYFGKDFEIPSFNKQTISLSENQMQKYVGKYVSDQLPMDIQVYIEKNTLKAQASGQSSFPLTATDTTTLRFNSAGIVMKFDLLKEDKYQQFTLQQAGGSYLFRRQN